LLNAKRCRQVCLTGKDVLVCVNVLHAALCCAVVAGVAVQALPPSAGLQVLRVVRVVVLWSCLM
jgi:hypothetical protein